MNKWFNKKIKANGKAKRKRDKHNDLDDDSDDDQYFHQQQHSNSNSSSSSSNNNNNINQPLNNNVAQNNNISTSPRKNKKKKKHPVSKLYVGDKILLKNNRSGKVTSLGPKPDRDGTWVRVVLDNNPNNNNPSDDNSNSNSNSNSKSKNKAMWVPMQNAVRIISHGKKFDLTIGDRVIEKKKHTKGCVRYVGPTHFDKGVWFGVELDTARGKNNGTVKKKFYFRAKNNHGVMLPYKRLEPENSKSKKKHRSYSDFDNNKNKNNKKKNNGHTRTTHDRTNSDGVVTRGQISQTLQLEQHINKHKQNKYNNDNNNNNNSYMNGNGNANSNTKGNYMNGSHTNHQNYNGNHNLNNGNMVNNIDINNNNNNDDDNLDNSQNKTPSTDSEDDVMFAQIKSPANNDNNNNGIQKKLIPKEKVLFQGWKKLVDDDDYKDNASPTPSPAPYTTNNNNINMATNNILQKPMKHYDLDDANLKILSKFLDKIKEFNGVEKELFESNLPSITEVNKDQRETIFVRKLHLCQAQCDFFDPRDQMAELIDKKERMLLELSEFIARHVWFKESLYEKCLLTVSFNLFRALPYQDRPPALSFFNDEVFDKDTNFEDPAWRHLKLVYDLTWRVINTPQVTAAMMEKHMTGKFIGNLVELFASEDHRERAYLMMILHKIYGRCLKLRPYIIQIMSGYFYRMIYADEFKHVNGIIELLQIICAIIPGLTVPVKDSWQKFVRNILVPLHKCRGLKKFWEQLTQCCVNYVAKDEDGGAVILGGLLRFWPQQSPQKEEIFIMEVVNIINVLITHQHGFSYENYKEVLVCSANKLTQCMLSTRQPVAERAIAAWKEQSMQRLVDYDRKAFLPKLCEAFYRNRDHANAALKQSSTAVEKIYRSKDSAYWKKMQQYLAKKDKKENAIAKAIDDAKLKKKDPYDIVKAKHAKDNAKKKRPKPLTTAEKKAKRDHFWKKVNKAAKINKKKFMKNNQFNDNNSVSSSSLDPPNLST